MILITEKHNCCGCSACVQACPKQCISFEEDEQGFRYPIVDEKKCVNCGLCEKVCPFLNHNEKKAPLKVYAAINKNEQIRLKSSSGGIFYLCAEFIIKEGGVVFGARFDENWEVVHDYTETIDGLIPFLRSKYLQSRIENTYVKVLEFLKQGRYVLFSGTSCQIAGLKHFLRSDFSNLLTIDVVCHGVPSPAVWRLYIQKTFKSCRISQISFRDKTKGWNNHSLKIKGKEEDKENILLNENFSNNKFMRIFLHNLCLRPSCSNCPSKEGRCQSDISLADYWGIMRIHPQMNDDKGTSLVLVNSEKGLAFFKKLDTKNIESKYECALRYNPCIEKSYTLNSKIPLFWNYYQKKQWNEIDSLLESFKPTFPHKCLTLMKKSIYFMYNKIVKYRKL